jgi:hypothetical protein
MSNILIYQDKDGITKIDVRFENETLWITQQQMADLFQTTKQNVSLHITNIYKEGELQELATVKDFLTVQHEGKRKVKRSLLHYNLDMIISVGYPKTNHSSAIPRHNEINDVFCNEICKQLNIPK